MTNLDNSFKQLIGEEKESDKPLIEVDDDEHKLDARIVYWAAHRGDQQLVEQAIVVRKISPFVKCFNERTWISGAILG